MEIGNGIENECFNSSAVGNILYTYDILTSWNHFDLINIYRERFINAHIVIHPSSSSYSIDNRRGLAQLQRLCKQM